ncbi:MAG: hypothetical protein WC849_01100 [Candidatus Paceibacterota bacterium]
MKTSQKDEVFIKCPSDKYGEYFFVKVKICKNGSDIYEVKYDDPSFIHEDRYLQNEVRELSQSNKVYLVEEFKLFKKEGSIMKTLSN